MNTTDNTTTEPQWAVIELMGHVRYGGRVSKDNQFGTAMLRVDVPMPDGSFVSQLVNPQSIYRITMSSEDIARAAAKGGQMAPLERWDLKHLLPAPAQSAPIADDDHPSDDELNY